MKYFSKLKTLLKKDDVIWNSVQFRNLEGIIMEYFKWNIFIPTPTHYADLLRSQIMFPSSLKVSMGKLVSYGLFNTNLKKIPGLLWKIWQP